MLATEREKYIRARILDKHVIYVNQLAEELKVTRPTIRNDLDKLVKKYDDLKRIHGGIMLKEDKVDKSLSEMILGYNERAFTNRKEKRMIAQEAIKLVQAGDTLLLDSSSSCFEFANVLTNYQEKITVITNGLTTGTVLKQNTNINVLVIGGLLKANSNTIYDEFSSPILDNFNIDKYFFSASGLSLSGGFSENNLMEVKHKRANVLMAKQAIALIDHTKFNKDSSSTFCSLDEVDHLITDAGLDTLIAAEFHMRIHLIQSQ